MLKIAPSVGSLILSRRRRAAAAPWTPTYLLRDDFLTDEAAPLASPRTAEPGPGTLTVGDSVSSISSQKLNYTNGSFMYTSMTPVAGRASIVSVTPASTGQVFLGNWNTSTNPNAYGLGAQMTFAGISPFADGSIAGVVGAFSTGVNYRFAYILMSGYVLVKGGAYTEWTLLYVAPITVALTHVLFRSYNGVGTMDWWRVAQLSAPFTTDYGIATQRIASPTAGATATAEANAIVEFTWTPQAGETLDFDVRRTDDDNRWIFRCSQSGSTIKLIERNAGSETERGSASQTWTPGTAYRIVPIMDGNTIRGYVANVLKWTYSSASFNNTATGVKVSHAGTDLVCWPRTLSGAALAALEAVSA